MDFVTIKTSLFMHGQKFGFLGRFCPAEEVALIAGNRLSIASFFYEVSLFCMFPAFLIKKIIQCILKKSPLWAGCRCCKRLHFLAKKTAK